MKKKIVFLLLLVIASFSALVSATYAGFTKQYNPEVKNFLFTVRTQENMMISRTGAAGTFKDDINFADFVSTSMVTPVKGIVNEDSIVLVDEYNSSVPQQNNYIKLTLYFSGTNDMNVYLAGSSSGTAVDPIEIENAGYSIEQRNKIIDSLRIGFVSYSYREVPTSSGATAIEYSPIETNVYSVNAKTNESYKDDLLHYRTFNTLSYTEVEATDVVLVNVSANKINKLDVYLWIESEDDSCDVNTFDINLKLNLRFFARNVESGDE